jgi:hypothetical protein
VKASVACGSRSSNERLFPASPHGDHGATQTPLSICCMKIREWNIPSGA